MTVYLFKPLATEVILNAINMKTEQTGFARESSINTKRQTENNRTPAVMLRLERYDPHKLLVG